MDKKTCKVARMWYNMGVLCLGRECKILFDRGI